MTRDRTEMNLSDEDGCYLWEPGVICEMQTSMFQRSQTPQAIVCVSASGHMLHVLVS